MDNKGRKLQGIVVSDKMMKTAVVAVSKLYLHKRYLKSFLRTSRLKAQNDDNRYKIGDEVVIQETRPTSKDKCWKIISLVKKAEPEKNPESKESNE